MSEAPIPFRTRSGEGQEPLPELGEEHASNVVVSETLIGDDEVDEAPEPECDWFAELQKNIKAKGRSPIIFKPVLGCEGYIRKARSHLLAAYPKGGKTELMVNILLEWEDEQILYVSEEARETWEDRAYDLPDWPNDMLVSYALGKSYETILKIVANWPGSVVVIDTIKLLGITDENDSSTVQAALAPFITQCRKKKQTLAFLHHDNKHGGKGGRGIAGSHAFVGIVDIFLEIDEVKENENQRILSGRGKIRNIKGLLYERSETDGLMRVIGTALVETQLKVLNTLSMLPQTTQEVATVAGISPETALKHLRTMAMNKMIERIPYISEPAKGKVVQWQRVISNS